MSDETKKQYWLALAAAREAMAYAYAMEAAAADIGDELSFPEASKQVAEHCRHMQKRYAEMAVNCRAVAAGFCAGVEG